MVKDRSREDEAIDQSHRDTDRNTRRQRAQHAAAGGSMNIKYISDAAIGGGNHYRMMRIDEAYVADKSLIQDVVDDFAFVEGAFWQTLQCSSLGRAKFCCSLHFIFSYPYTRVARYYGIRY